MSAIADAQPTAHGSSVPDQLYIDGAWTDAAEGATLEIVDPASDRVVGSIASAGEADVDAALRAAAAGFALWRDVGPWERSAVLRETARLIVERHEQIAAAMTEEQGKPLAEARAEVLASADQFDWYADEARRVGGRLVEAKAPGVRIAVRREPVGVVAAFSAWNFPALLPARKLAPALAAGCAVIVKPAQEAPRSLLCLVQALHDAGLPAGVVNALTGPSAPISKRLLASPVVRKVTLTGSIPVGRAILHEAAEGIKQVSMELGGHAPVLVFADADPSATADAIVRAKFRNAGQVCISPSRFYVHESLHDDVVGEVVRLTGRLRLGPGSDPQTDVGPLTNRRRVDAVHRLIADAVDRGAELACGGPDAPVPATGCFLAPTVLSDVDDDMAVMREEPFGPVAPFAPFASLDEVVERANGTEHGLAAYVFTRDLTTAHLASERLEAGMVGVNNLVIATAEAPFGGIKQSGYGREGGSEGMDAYTVAKYVNTKL